MNNKVRNRLIALIAFLLFLATGFFFFHTRNTPKPFGIILFIADGISPEVLTATRLYQGGSNYHLHMEELPHMALTRVEAQDSALADSAASATAIAIGKKVSQHSLGIETGEKATPSLLEEAAQKNRLTGLVSNGSLLDPTLAAFYAKLGKSFTPRDNANELAHHKPIDLLIGKGQPFFLPQKASSSPEKTPPNGQNCLDRENLLTTLQKKGYQLHSSFSEWKSTSFWAPSPTISFLEEENSLSQTPPLSELVQKAIEHLQHQTHGYFLVVDDAIITKASLDNQGEDLLEEMSNLDQAIATAREYAGPKTLIMVTGKQLLGGMMMNGTPLPHDQGVAVLGVNGAGFPSISWSSGPGNHLSPSSQQLDKGAEAPQGASILEEPSAIPAPQGLPIVTDTLTLGEGQGSEKLSGFIDQPTLHQLISKQL
jgi:alkaline phosphatase